MLTTAFCKNDTTSFNPYFRDSVLKNKVDTARWQQLRQSTDLRRTAGASFVIQHQKQPDTSKAFLLIATLILIVLLVMRLLFDDFSYSLLEGLLSVKKFFIYYKTKKYDSFLAVFSLYVLKIIILALVVDILLLHLTHRDFRLFDPSWFVDVVLALSVFFVLKNLVEFVFNVVIGTQDMFRAFFLQNLFAEFMLSLLLLLILLIYVYNDGLGNGMLIFVCSLVLGLFAVFNIVRSYQLMGNVRVTYKLHFFLYICAFKILPLLLLAKYILSNVVES